MPHGMIIWSIDLNKFGPNLRKYIRYGKAEICQVEENGKTAEGEALYYAGLHLHASWLAQVLLELASLNHNDVVTRTYVRAWCARF